MTTRRQVLAGLAGMLVPGMALAQGGGQGGGQGGAQRGGQGGGQGKPPAKAKPAQGKPASGAATGRGEAAARGSRPASGKPAGQGGSPRREAPTTSGAPGQGGSPRREAAATGRVPGNAEPIPAAASRPPDPDLPALRPLDRTLVRGWLEANPDWGAPALPQGQRRRLAEGKPLPPGIAARALPPGLAVTLPFFPGYRYAAVGHDLVLVESATGVVASLLAGALAR